MDVVNGKFSPSSYYVYYSAIGILYGVFVSACIVLNLTYDKSLLLYISNFVLTPLFISYVLIKVVISTSGDPQTEVSMIRNDIIMYMGVLATIFIFYHVIVITIIYLLFPNVNAVFNALNTSVKIGLGLFFCSYVLINLLLIGVVFHLGKKYMKFTLNYVTLASMPTATTYALVNQFVSNTDEV